MVIITGITASAPGLATILMAGTIGTLIDRAGSLKSLITFLCFAVMCLILTAFVKNVWQLIIFRFLLGVADAALIPALQVLTVQNVPERIFGRVFSYNQSAQASGNVIGPIFAAGIANIIGYKSIFIFAAVGEVVALGTWIYYLRTKSVN
jgi:Arabinose efflux permease